MVYIELSETETSYQSENHSITVKKEPCQDFNSFEKVIYKIDYNKKYSSSSYWEKYSFYLYIKNKKKELVFTYGAYNNNHVVTEVDSYYSKKHPDVPLVIGFKRDDTPDFKFYTFVRLKTKRSSYGFDIREDFDREQLESKLKEEDEKRNKIKFVSTRGKSANCEEKKEHTISGYTKFSYFAKDTQSHGTYELSADLLIKHETQNNVDSSFFHKYNDRKFDYINVYYTTPGNVALLVEFDDETGKFYYERKDFNGTYWNRKTIENERNQLETHLKGIKDEYDKKISYHLEKKVNDQSTYRSDRISVSTHQSNGFTVCSHTPNLYHRNKTSFLLFRKVLLEIDKVDQISVSPLDDIHKKTYSSILVNYYNSSVEGKKVDLEVPFFMELKENGSDTRYYLLRVDKEGKRWKQVEDTFVNLDERSNVKLMLEHIDYYSNKSIMILINHNGINVDQYPIHLIDNSSVKVDKTSKHSSINVTISQGGNLTGSNFKYCKHIIPQSKTIRYDENGFSISGLRLFISDSSNRTIDHNNSVEINTYNNNGSKREILYHESNGSNEILYVYFHSQGNMPMLVQHKGKFYKPYSKDKYFEKWIEERNLRDSKPENNTNNKIKDKLDDINKNFNEIDISRSSVGGYGIKKSPEVRDGKEYYESDSKSFIGKRVDIQQRKTDKYIKVIHSTSDKDKIGEIKCGSEEIMDHEDKKLSAVLPSLQYNTVTVHYHKTDLNFLRPLLIKIGATSSTSSVFYERLTKDTGAKWKKVGDTSKLQQDGSDLANKINDVHYNLTNSFKIHLDKQSKDDYPIKLVKNDDSSDVHASDVASGTINVVEDYSSSTETKYTSHKHSINFSQSRDIGGIRLYIFDEEVSTYKSNGTDSYPIYYDTSIKDLYVYFSGINKVPLLLLYNNQYYMPSSRDQYFQRWNLTEIGERTQLQSKLDDINKNLNQIDISETKHGIKYGIPKPRTVREGFDEEFCNRVSVTSCRNKHFIRVTHTTTNGFMGRITYDAKSTNVSPHTTHNTNQLCVFYHPSDHYFTKPLLIKVCSSSDSDVCQWYSRTSIDVLEWKEESGKDKYDTDIKLGQQINLIGNLFISLLIQIDKQGLEYYITATNGNDLHSKSHKAKISLNLMDTRDSIKVDNYRFYYHNLSDYYKENVASLKSEFSLSDGSDPELELVIQMFEKRIILLDSNGKPLNPPLTFKKSDFEQNLFFYVYFYESKYSFTIDSTDKIPLLIHYKDNFYQPISKNSFFRTWKKVTELSNLDSSVIGSQVSTNGIQQRDQAINQQKKEKVKNELDKINKMLNEVDNSKLGDYGLPYCGNPYYNKKGRYKFQENKCKKTFK